MDTDLKMMVIAKLAADALEVQDACNLSGVAQGFAKAMLALRSLGLDTKACNENAITRLWLDKLNSLAGIQPTDDQDYTSKLRAAFEWAEAVRSK